MRILITGADGQLGKSFLKNLKKSSIHVFSALNKREMDICNFENSFSVIKNFRPDIIINTAAYTQVDDAEDNEEKVFQINRDGVFNLSKICKEFDIPLIHFSTDYIFDGLKKDLYSEDDKPNPINKYGLSKLQGEEQIFKTIEKYLIIRISWVFSDFEGNFLSKILELSKLNTKIDVVSDQIGNPTSTDEVSKKIIEILPKINDNWGVYNLVQNPSVSWAEFAEKIINISFEKGFLKDKTIIKKVLSSQYKTKAKRPMNSRMSTIKICKTFNISIDSWESSLINIFSKNKNEI